jgi:hypothetical protein
MKYIWLIYVDDRKSCIWYIEKDDGTDKARTQCVVFWHLSKTTRLKPLPNLQVPEDPPHGLKRCTMLQTWRLHLKKTNLLCWSISQNQFSSLFWVIFFQGSKYVFFTNIFLSIFKTTILMTSKVFLKRYPYPYATFDINNSTNEQF